MDFERYSPGAIKAIMLGQAESRCLGWNFHGTEQILVGLIAEDKGIAARALRALGGNLEDAKVTVEEIIGRGSDMPEIEIPFTARAKRAIELSFNEADRADQSIVDTEHLLLALICEGESVACEVLRRLKVDLGHIRPMVQQVLLRLQELCTAKALKAIASAEEEPGHVICAENLLIGLMSDESCIAAKAIRLSQLRLATVRNVVRDMHKGIPLEPNLEVILKRAYAEGCALNNDYIGTGHLLLALLSDSKAVAVLEQLTVDPKVVRSKLLRLLDGWQD